MSTSSTTNHARRRGPSLASRIAAAKLVAAQFRELARIAGQGSPHHERMLARARAWQGRVTKLARLQNSGLPETFTPL